MISEQDFDRLSAYIDNELSANEKSALEARLLKEPDLKAALRDLRLQARAMRDLPKVKVPRNFTLTAKQAEAIRPARRSWMASLFPALRMATALSAFAFVATLATNLIQQPVLQTASAPVQSDQFMREAAPGVANTAPEAGGASATQALELTPTAKEVITGTAEAGIAGLAAPSETQVVEGTPAPAEDALVQQFAETENPVAASAPPAEDGAVIPPGLPPLQLAAIGLGALTLILAVFTWLARR